MATTKYLKFYIVLTDPALVKEYQERTWHTGTIGGRLPPGLVNRAIYNAGPPEGGAAIEFGAPFRGYEELAAGAAPYIWTPWSGEGEEDGPFPINVATFERKTGGFWGIGGTTTRYYWMGEFVLAPDADAAGDDGEEIPEAERALIPSRRFVEGFEHPATYGSSSATLQTSMDAARHADGYGLAQRGASNLTISKATSLHDGPTFQNTGWERLYVRLRGLPDVTTQFWSSVGYPTSALGNALAVTPDGSLVVLNVTSSTASTVRGVVGALEEWTGLATHHAWVRLDILINHNDGTFRVYWNGALALSTGINVVASGSGGFQSTRVGNAKTEANTLKIDIDDWMQADIPVNDAAEETLNGRDWLNGSKIALVRPTAYTAAHSGWTGDLRVLLQRVAGSSGFTIPQLSSSTALALIAVDTDAELSVDADPQALGVVAMLVSLVSLRGSTSGKLGYSVGGAAAVLTSITQSITRSFNSVMYSGPGTGKTIAALTPIELQHQKGNDTSASWVYGLFGQAEIIGTFGPEDVREAVLEGGAAPAFEGLRGTHNHPYPRSPWARHSDLEQLGPYMVHAGTYTGNGTGQDLTFPAPVGLIFIRPVAGGAGLWWHTSLLGGHASFQAGAASDFIGGDEDPDFVAATGEDAQQTQYRVRLAGNHAQFNASATTYQYVAVMDPAARFMLNQHMSTMLGETDDVHTFWDETFEPEWAFAFLEEINTGTTTVRLYSKGLSQKDSAAISNYSSAAPPVNPLTFGTGQATTHSTFHGMMSVGASFWRRSDGNNDPGEVDVLSVGTYTGDGAASRTIGCGTGTTKRPLFALVDGESGEGAFRDPSHTSSNSLVGGANSATGITAGGVDSFTVGSSLNASGVVYNWWILWGSATAGNNGWSPNGDFVPVEAGTGTGGVDPGEPTGEWDDTPTTPTTPTPGAPPTTPDTGGTHFSGLCGEWSTYVVNVALARIGVNKQLADVGTDTSQEAYTARLLYVLDLESTLRAFPWPFATRYAELVLEAGTTSVPVNADWQYSYRAPDDMAFARRIVGQARQGRRWDVDPIRFRVGADDDGSLIYTDAVGTDDIPVVLEYTIQLDCAVRTGDEMFRDAFAWKLASSLAASLAKDKDKARYCELMFRDRLEDAKVVTANEQQQDPPGDAPWITGR